MAVSTKSSTLRQLAILVIVFVAIMGCSGAEQSSPQVMEASDQRSPQSVNDDMWNMDESSLRTFAADSNRRMPQNVANGVRAEKVSVGPGRVVTYHLTIVDSVATDVTPARIALVEAMQIESTCNSEYLELFLSEGITIKYLYKTGDGAEFASIDITHSVCPNAAGT